MDMLLKCALASKLSYKDFKKRSKTRRLGFRDQIKLGAGPHSYGMYKYKFVNKAPAQCLILENENEIIVAIRGTADFQDVKSDIDIHHTNDNLLGEVHEGFYEQMKKLEPTIVSALENVSSTKKIYITGHSLGGAIAKLLTLRLSLSLRSISCVTFGEPKSITKKNNIKEYLYKNKSFYCTINNTDIVTKVPPKFKRGIPAKLETVYYFNRKNELSVNPSRHYMLYDQLVSWLENIFSELEDHTINNYIYNIKLNKEKE